MALSTTGFGWSFYGFFLAAALWMAVYFLWSFRAARRERVRDKRHADLS